MKLYKYQWFILSGVLNPSYLKRQEGQNDHLKNVAIYYLIEELRNKIESKAENKPTNKPIKIKISKGEKALIQIVFEQSHMIDNFSQEDENYPILIATIEIIKSQFN